MIGLVTTLSLKESLENTFLHLAEFTEMFWETEKHNIKIKKLQNNVTIIKLRHYSNLESQRESNGIKSGDLVVHSVDLPLPIHQLENIF